MADIFQSCCLTSFPWSGTPSGREEKLAGLPTYITGDSTSAAVLFVHDALGWQFGNARLLADCYAKEANVTVYMPDFFNGEVLDSQAIHEGRWGDIDLPGFSARNARHIREPTIFGAARDIRSKGYAKIGAIGFCFGGWAVLRLATPLPENDNKPLVDAIVCAHPSWVVEKDFDGVSVPIMFLAPEVDKPFPDELKAYAFKALVAKKKVQFEWVHFPGVEHGCLTKGDEQVKGERAAMAKGKVAAVRWFKEWLSG